LIDDFITLLLVGRRTQKMKNEEEKKKEKESAQWDCVSFPCGDSCCQHGVDVFAHERDLLISAGTALESDFSGPNTDEDGAVMYRTQIGPRGCVFLMDGRGCRLHISGHKPLTCHVWPRTFQEAQCAAGEGYLPCFPLRYNKE
jgi:Fe-S-cluster containining protein